MNLKEQIERVEQMRKDIADSLHTLRDYKSSWDAGLRLKELTTLRLLLLADYVAELERELNLKKGA